MKKKNYKEKNQMILELRPVQHLSPFLTVQMIDLKDSNVLLETLVLNNSYITSFSGI